MPGFRVLISRFSIAAIIFAAFTLFLFQSLHGTQVSAQTPATVNLTKSMWDPGEADVVDNSTSFMFSVTGQSDVSLAGGQSHQYALAAGTYQITETLNSDYTFVECDASFSAGGSSTPLANGIEITVTDAENVTVNCINKQKTGTVSGYVWADLDANSSYDCSPSCEDKLDGWSVFLDYNSNGVQDPSEVIASTSGGGDYTFSGVYPGTYRVCELVQDGWLVSYPVNGAHNCNTVSVASAQSYSGMNFGNREDLFPSVSYQVSPSTSVVSPQQIILTASGTAGDSPLSYSWSCNSGISSVTAVLTVSAVGTHSCTVTVTDSDGDQATANTSVTIQPPPPSNRLPRVFVFATPSMTVTEGTVVKVQGNIVDGNPGFDYVWSEGCTGSGHVNSLGVTGEVSLPSKAGMYYCRLDVTDIDGDKAFTGVIVQVKSQSTNSVPTSSVVNPPVAQPTEVPVVEIPTAEPTFQPTAILGEQSLTPETSGSNLALLIVLLIAVSVVVAVGGVEVVSHLQSKAENQKSKQKKTSN